MYAGQIVETGPAEQVLSQPQHEYTRRLLASVPELPTMIELGYKDFDSSAWFGLMAPAGTPQPIIDRLHQETVRILARADIRERFDVLGMEPIGNTPAEFAAVIAAETPQWAKVIKDAGIKAGE